MREWQILLCALIFDFLNNIHHSVWGMMVNSLRTSDEHIFHSQEWNFLLAKVAFYIPHHTPCIVDLIIKYYLCHTLHGVVSRNDFPSQFASHLYIWSEVISQSNPPRPHFWMTQGRVNSKKKGVVYLWGRQSPRGPSHTAALSTLSPGENTYWCDHLAHMTAFVILSYSLFCGQIAQSIAKCVQLSKCPNKRSAVYAVHCAIQWGKEASKNLSNIGLNCFEMKCYLF